MYSIKRYISWQECKSIQNLSYLTSCHHNNDNKNNKNKGIEKFRLNRKFLNPLSSLPSPSPTFLPYTPHDHIPRFSSPHTFFSSQISKLSESNVLFFSPTFSSASCWIFLLFFHWLPCDFLSLCHRHTLSYHDIE